MSKDKEKEPSTEKKAKRKRATRLEKEERINFTLQCLALNSTKVQLVQHLMSEYDIKERQAYLDIQEAESRLSASVTQDQSSFLGLQQSRLEMITGFHMETLANPASAATALKSIKQSLQLSQEVQKAQILKQGEANGSLERNPLLGFLARGQEEADGPKRGNQEDV